MKFLFIALMFLSFTPQQNTITLSKQSSIQLAQTTNINKQLSSEMQSELKIGKLYFEMALDVYYLQTGTIINKEKAIRIYDSIINTSLKRANTKCL